jgi:hypothetical protein
VLFRAAEGTMLVRACEAENPTTTNVSGPIVLRPRNASFKFAHVSRQAHVRLDITASYPVREEQHRGTNGAAVDDGLACKSTLHHCRRHSVKQTVQTVGRWVRAGAWQTVVKTNCAINALFCLSTLS